MAFTRNWLKSLSLTDEQIGAIIEEHTSVTDALKEQRDKARQEAQTMKEEADKLPEIRKELDDLKSGEDYKSKYESEHKAFEDYKTQIAEKEQEAKVKAAYRKLLTDERIKEDRLDMVMRHTDFSGMKLDKDGNLEGSDALKKEIGEEWGVFQVTTKERKQTVPTPPGGRENVNPTGTSRARELYLERLKKQGVKIEDIGKE